MNIPFDLPTLPEAVLPLVAGVAIVLWYWFAALVVRRLDRREVEPLARFFVWLLSPITFFGAGVLVAVEWVGVKVLGGERR